MPKLKRRKSVYMNLNLDIANTSHYFDGGGSFNAMSLTYKVINHGGQQSSFSLCSVHSI